MVDWNKEAYQNARGKEQMQHKVLNIAHRGARSLAPENTLQAALKALEAGADMWEVDISLSKDGQPVIVHDDTLVRTTNAVSAYPHRAPWVVSDFSLAEIEHLDAGSWFEKTDPFGEIAAGHVSAQDLRAYHGIHVPTLDDVLVFTRTHHWSINLELKEQPELGKQAPIVSLVLERVRKLHMENQVLISSFQHEWLRQVRELAPDIEIAALIGIEEAQKIDWDTLEFPMYNLHVDLATEELITWLKDAGRRVAVWVVNEPESMEHFATLGVDGIFTDFPQRLTRVLVELDP